jgi:predicted nuclease of predicted toxin-antitoxin system
MRRLLIDECINPRLTARLRSALPDDSVDTVRELQWSGRKDHVLIREIRNRFDVFLTIDKGFEFEHDLKDLPFGIVVIETANNQMASYERVLDELISEIQRVEPGTVTHVIDRERT